MQVERRVVNVIAQEFERGNIMKGSSVHLVITDNGTRPLITLNKKNR